MLKHNGTTTHTTTPVTPAVMSDIVEIKHIMLPPNARDFKDIYVVFELMETDLHQVGPPGVSWGLTGGLVCDGTGDKGE